MIMNRYCEDHTKEGADAHISRRGVIGAFALIGGAVLASSFVSRFILGNQEKGYERELPDDEYKDMIGV